MQGMTYLVKMGSGTHKNKIGLCLEVLPEKFDAKYKGVTWLKLQLDDVTTWFKNTEVMPLED